MTSSAEKAHDNEEIKSADNGHAEAAPAAETAAPQAPSADDLLKEEKKKYVYLYAEFENFKKRTQKERMDLVKFGWEPIARDLLGILDNLELAINHAPATTDKNFLEGVKMVNSHFRDTLARQGVKPIAAVAKPFDPNFHDAVGEEESDLPTGTVTKEHTAGFTLHDRLLRPARVSVSKGKN